MTEFTRITQIASDHPCLAGHFPGRPIVPAVLLLDRVAEALRLELGPLSIGAVSNAKFLAPVSPGDEITMQVVAERLTGKARFRCLVGEQLVAQGELAFAPNAAPA